MCTWVICLYWFLCDDTILALRYIHALHTYGTYIYLHIHLSRYLHLSVCPYIPKVQYLFFFLFLFLFYTNFRSTYLVFSIPSFLSPSSLLFRVDKVSLYQGTSTFTSIYQHHLSIQSEANQSKSHQIICFYRYVSITDVCMYVCMFVCMYVCTL